MSGSRLFAVLTAVMFAVCAALTIAGCSGFSEAHSYNAPKPAKTYIGNWVRLGTPGTYPTLVFECFGTDGVFVANDNYTSAFVVRDDPHCGASS